MIKRLDQYLISQILMITLIMATVLVGIMVMTQSLRFLDLIMNAGASGIMFLTLTLLAVPRFFEVIIPIALSASTVYVFSRLRQDGELTILQTSGLSPARIARAGILAAVISGVVLFFILGFLAPFTLSRLYELRQNLRVQYSTALIRPGVFNAIGSGITIFISERTDKNTLKGVMIYDTRPEHPKPVTILAQSGTLWITDQGPRIQVENGLRLSRSTRTDGFDRLSFDRYILDFPETGPLQKRWAEPEERSLKNLLFDAQKDETVRAQFDEFRAEIHRRFLSPLLPLTLYIPVILVMMGGVYTRVFQNAGRIVAAGVVILGVMGGYIALFSAAKTGILGIVLMYIWVFGILGTGLLALQNRGRHPK